ncbi:MAG: hypothetical protein GF383_12900 [Candidatus Lokiarchaeota archaeon]|nr:hypothetical protein [Candidatus Lokiarchaeota archaeon]
MSFELETLYELVEDNELDDLCDLVLEIFYKDEDPMDAIRRVAAESNLIAGDPEPIPESQLERIDLFLEEVELDRLDSESLKIIMTYCIPFKESLENYSDIEEYYNERFEEDLES